MFDKRIIENFCRKNELKCHQVIDSESADIPQFLGISGMCSQTALALIQQKFNGKIQTFQCYRNGKATIIDNQPFPFGILVNTNTSCFEVKGILVKISLSNN